MLNYRNNKWLLEYLLERAKYDTLDAESQDRMNGIIASLVREIHRHESIYGDDR